MEIVYLINFNTAAIIIAVNSGGTFKFSGLVIECKMTKIIIIYNYQCFWQARSVH